MNTLRTLARLPRNERALFFRALLVVVVMRVGLSLSSFQRVQKITKPKDQTAPEFADLPVLRFALGSQCCKQAGTGCVVPDAIPGIALFTKPRGI